MNRPFIYIAGLRRTGSTVLSEALTLLPHCFIFREPRLAEYRFSTHQSDVELFLHYGIDLVDFEQRWRYGKRDQIIAAFKSELLPQLAAHIAQIGIKEIRNDRWRRLWRFFPDMRVILTGRDPRDIYLSLHHKVKYGNAKWAGLFTEEGLFCPEAVARGLNREFREQKAMFETLPCMKVKYEDLCQRPELVEEVKTFAGCAVAQIGAVGAFNAANPLRVEEYQLHGDRITPQRIQRWREEKDEALLAEAQAAFELMPDYCSFWGYEA